MYLDVFFQPTCGLKEGNCCTECLYIPNPFLAQVLRIFKSGALLMLDFKISKEI